MGNRHGCSLFSGVSLSPEEKMWVDGLTEDENLLIKDIYTSMAVSYKEVTILELKRSLDLQMIFMRKRKRVTHKMEQIFDYIEMTLRRDLAQQHRYRIGLDEFYALWQTAYNEKKLEDRKQVEAFMGGNSQRATNKEKNSCLDCFSCQRRDKLTAANQNESDIVKIDEHRLSLSARTKHQTYSSRSVLDGYSGNGKALLTETIGMSTQTSAITNSIPQTKKRSPSISSLLSDHTTKSENIKPNTQLLDDKQIVRA